MNVLMIFLRLVHIFSGIFWVGTSLFFVLFFEKIVKSAGPAGGAVMGKLAMSSFPTAAAFASGLTVAAGLAMYYIDSKGFQGGWILSPGPLTLTVGSISGILAMLVGLTVQRPAMARLSALQKEIQQAGGQPTPAQLQELQAVQKRFSMASRLAVVLMVIAVIGMESAREVGSIE